MNEKTRYFFATVARGLEPLAAEELLRLGARTVKPGFCGVEFQGDRALLYRVNLWARLPFRVLVRIGEFRCHDGDSLYQGIQTINWQTHLSPAHTLAVDATGKTGYLNHTHFNALQVKNAIVEQQQRRTGRRSSVDVQTPDVRVNVHLHRNRCVVSLDSSGHSLHRRGYRSAVGQAPLKETLAAALIFLTGWRPELPFIDPLCGSGTLPLEAGFIALNIAPGLFCKEFGFQRWPDFDRPLWQTLVEEARTQRRDQLPDLIWGCDRDPDVIAQAQANAEVCGLQDQVQFFQQDLADLAAPSDRGVIMCNPPYGHRLGQSEELAALYRLLGDVLKQRFKGWTAYVLSGNKALAQAIRLKSSQRMPVLNGSLPCQLMKYEIY